MLAYTFPNPCIFRKRGRGQSCWQDATDVGWVRGQFYFLFIRDTLYIQKTCFGGALECTFSASMFQAVTFKLVFCINFNFDWRDILTLFFSNSLQSRSIHVMSLWCTNFEKIQIYAENSQIPLDDVGWQICNLVSTCKCMAWSIPLHLLFELYYYQYIEQNSIY